MSPGARARLGRYDSNTLRLVEQGLPGALEGLLALADSEDGAYLRIEVLGYDSLSSSRRYFESRPLYVGDILLGRFEAGDSFRIAAPLSA